MTCIHCQKHIPALRLEILPLTETCVGCSTERPITEKDVDLDTTSPDDLKAMVRTNRSEQ